MSLPAIIGIGGHALLLSAIILRIACALNLRKSYSYALVVATLLLTVLSIGSLSAAEVTRGIFGDLSITTIVLLGYFLIFPTSSRDKSNQLFILAVITGFLFYPAALGLGMVDPYQWGYLNSYRGMEIPMNFLAGLLALLLIAGQIKNDLIMACIIAAMGAYMLGAMESKNIWDYLIDPLIVTFGIFRIIIEFIKQIFGHYRARKDINS